MSIFEKRNSDQENLKWVKFLLCEDIFEEKKGKID